MRNNTLLKVLLTGIASVGLLSIPQSALAQHGGGGHAGGRGRLTAGEVLEGVGGSTAGADLAAITAVRMAAMAEARGKVRCPEAASARREWEWNRREAPAAHVHPLTGAPTHRQDGIVRSTGWHRNGTGRRSKCDG